MNNKGFAITTILYGTLILFMLLLVSMLGILSIYKDRLTMLIDNNNGARSIINYRNIGGFELENVPSASARMTYTINNEVVTVKATLNDGYGYVPYYVELEEGKTYVFSCDTDGRWYGNGSDVEAFLMLNGNHTSFDTTTVHLQGNKNYYFTPPATGRYWLRLDVNVAGKTHNFENITILGR